MTDKEQKQLACELSALSVFRNILKTDTMSALVEYLGADDAGAADCAGGCSAYKMSLMGRFVHSLSEYGFSFSEFLRKSVFEDENAYITRAAANRTVSAALLRNVLSELVLLSGLTKLSAKDLCGACAEGGKYGGYVPEFDNEYVDLRAEYFERLKHIDRYGYGIFASYPMFYLSEGDILPVKAADDITEADLTGYERERALVFDNTEALACGRPAANCLLFGDAGTGKSSTVKACVNRFYGSGVRLIELRKDQISYLPYIMGRIADNPLKFIIFIDDLSFNKNDDSFSMLKAALEGSASAKAENAVIYATSNRRHIVKESFSDRSGEDDIHRNDTMQELMSLSDRFGLTVYFEKPDKKLYLEIVHALAEKYGIDADAEGIDARAEAFALGKGGRSPRAAEQFINTLRRGTL